MLPVIFIVLGVVLLSAGDMVAQTYHAEYCKTCRRIYGVSKRP
jgi:hypothetical protein